MEWVKSKIGYYRLIPIAVGSDALEVMFKRADALAGELGENGFIPEAMLGSLCRRPAQAKRLAAQLVAAELWAKVRGGYLIVDWAEINAEAVRLTEKKRRERERKRASRASDRDSSTGQSGAVSADSPADSPVDSLYESERKSKSKTAAAAAGAAAAADLPGQIEILRSKLQAHTPLRGLRFDRLTADQVTQLTALIDLHGDTALVDLAINTCRNPAPTYVSAFLGNWEAMPPPGRPLHVVRPRYCDTHNTRLSPAGVCSSCAADARAQEK